jgi:hypothetical protein
MVIIPTGGSLGCNVVPTSVPDGDGIKVVGMRVIEGALEIVGE